MRGIGSLRASVGLLASLACASCATILDGTHQRVMFDSIPPGAVVHVDGYPDGSTPGALELSRKHGYVATIHKDGYRDESVPIQCDLNTATFWNILAGGFWFGMVIDAADGAMGELEPSTVSVTLQPDAPQPAVADTR